MSSKNLLIYLLLSLVVFSTSAISAENYVNWKGGFWLTMPEGWDKVNYRQVDRFLAVMDTSKEIFYYEVVLAPTSSELFFDEAYIVITFDSTGKYTDKEADSVLRDIAGSYSTDVFDAPMVRLMTDLVPGKPRINKAERVVSVLTDMAYRPESKKKLWLYMRLNDLGLISLYFYSPDSSFAANKKVFDKIVESLSFEGLKEAAKHEKFIFTQVDGQDRAQPSADTSSGGRGQGSESTGDDGDFNSTVVYIVIGVIVVIIILVFVIGPRIRKKRPADSDESGT